MGCSALPADTEATDHDYAVPTREYQTDQSSLKSAQAAARPVLGKSKGNSNPTIVQS
jgi:hypothetical protein